MSGNEGVEIVRKRASILSPLRYPGSKRRLASYVAESLVANDLAPTTLVEPFAGSASVSLQLLSDRVVQLAAIGEKDPLLASFWRVVFGDCSGLIRQMESTDVTLERWLELKKTSGCSDLSRAFACLFLNRTSYSGILRADSGPIGGYAGTSRYDIGCRFPKSTISKRIRMANALKEKILFVHEGEWRETIERAERITRADRLFLYLDPPFYKAGPRLYTHAFSEQDHVKLCHYLSRLKMPWMLSYDPAAEIVELYTKNGIHPRHVSLLYSAGNGTSNRIATELIITNLRNIPRHTRLWKTA